MKKRQILIIVMILLLSSLLNLSSVNAHKVIIFAWVEDGIVFSQSHFGSKRPAKNCNITVVNGKKQVIHTGKTNEKGNFSFKIPENIDSDLVLTLDAGQGHQANCRVSEKELKIVSTKKDIKHAMETKTNLEKNPSVYKIIAGICFIFFLVFALKLIQKLRARQEIT